MIEQMEKTPIATSDSPLPGAIKLLKSAWPIYKKRFWILIGVFFGPIVLTTSISGSLSLSRSSSVGTVLLFNILVLLINSFGTASLFYAIKDSDENIGIGEAYRRGWHILVEFIVVNVLAGLAIFGGFILLIIPGIIFAIWFSQASWILIDQGLDGASALARSKYYITKNWGDAGSTIIVLYAIYAATSWLFSYFVGLIHFSAFKTPIILSAGELIPLLFFPLIQIALFLLYKRLKEAGGRRMPARRTSIWTWILIIITALSAAFAYYYYKVAPLMNQSFIKSQPLSPESTNVINSVNLSSYSAIPGNSLDVTWNRTGNFSFPDTYYFVYLKSTSEQLLGNDSNHSGYMPLIFRQSFLNYPSFSITLPPDLSTGTYYLELDYTDSSGNPITSYTSSALTVKG